MLIKLSMNESFLHFIWQYGLFNHEKLETTCGKSVQIVRRGFLNTNSGPDFHEAHVIISGTEWVGNIEIHVNAAEWFEHGHQHDPAYNNTVLHVVLNGGTEAKRNDGSGLPELVLAGRIPAGHLQRWKELHGNLLSIPCAGHQPALHESAVMTMRHRTVAERITQKATKVNGLAAEMKNDWETVLFRLVCRYMGFQVNTGAMEMLSEALPFGVVRKCTHSLEQLEALFFGQAGLLNFEQRDDYMDNLRKEYNYLKKKFDLPPSLDPVIWKFGRLRPMNFPSVRIAQLAALYHTGALNFSELLDCSNVASMQKKLNNCASGYWDNHYRPGIMAANKQKTLGKDAVNGLIINAVVPVLFTYASHIQSESLRERAFDFLSSLPAEENAITRAWKVVHLRNKDAYDSQALLGLRELYCLKRRCLDCAIGQSILRNEDKLMIA